MTSVGVMASSVVVSAGTDVLMEPFNDFTTNSWTLVGSTSLIVAGRTGTAAAVSASGSNYATWTVPAINESDTITVGFAYRHTDASTGIRDVLNLLSDAGATLHNRLVYTGSTTTLAFLRSATTIAQNTSVTLAQNTWYYVEVQCKLHDTTGTVIVRVDGVEKINATALDTKNVGTKTTFDRVRIINNLTGATNTGQWDDLYITMGAGAPFKGDITVP